MRLLLIAFFVLLVGWTSSASANTSIQVPIAIMFEDASMGDAAVHVSMDYNFDSPLPILQAMYSGMILVHHTVNDQMGGLPVGASKYVFNTTMYNMLHYNLSYTQMAEFVIEQGAKFVFLGMDKSPYDEYVVPFSTACETGHRCIIFPNISINRLYTCVDESTPECVGRVGLRRFYYSLIVQPDWAYVAESFIGHMAQKQQSTMALVTSGAATLDADAVTRTPLIAESNSISVVHSEDWTDAGMNELGMCSDASVAALVARLQTSRADFLVVLAKDPFAMCWVQVLQRMEQEQYFPNAMALMGGLFNIVMYILSTTGQMSLMEYVYAASVFDPRTTGFDFNALSTATHTELFPSVNETSSTGVFMARLPEVTQSPLVLTSYAPLAMLSATSFVTICHLLELSGGSLHPPDLQAASTQVNSPSFAGLLQFDSLNGLNRGLQKQILTYVFKDSSSSYSTCIISATSRCQDTVPALNWPVRLYRTYLVNGDKMKADYDPTLSLLAVGILFVSTWGGFARMKLTVKDNSDMASVRAPYVQIVLVALSYGFAGNWAYCLVAHQALRFHPIKSSEVQAELLVNTPVWAVVLSAFMFLVVAWAVRESLRMNSTGRTLASLAWKKRQREADAVTATQTATNDDTPRTNNATIIQVRDDGDDEVEEDGDGYDYDSPLIKMSVAAAADARVHVSDHLPEGDAGSSSPPRGCCRCIVGILVFLVRLPVVCKGIPYSMWGKLLKVSLWWSLGPFFTQLILFQSFKNTKAVPMVSSVDSQGLFVLLWAGLYLLTVVVTMLTNVLGTYIYSSDIVIPMLMCLPSILLHFLTLGGVRGYVRTYIYQDDGDVGTDSVAQNTIILLGGIIGILLTIVSLSFMLHESGVDASANKRVQKKDRKRIRLVESAFEYCLQMRHDDRCTSEHNETLRHISERFEASQRAFLENGETIKCATSHARYARYLKKFLLQKAELETATAAKMVDGEVTREDVHMFVSVFQVNRREIERARKNMIQDSRARLEVVAAAANNNNNNDVTPLVQAATATVDTLWRSPELSRWLLHALRNKFSSENWYFLWALDQLDVVANQQGDEEEIREECAYINEVFIRAKSPLQINIHADVVKEVALALHLYFSPSDNDKLRLAMYRSTLSKCRAEVVKLIEQDNMGIFKANPTFDDALRAFSP